MLYQITNTQTIEKEITLKILMILLAMEMEILGFLLKAKHTELMFLELLEHQEIMEKE